MADDPFVHQGSWTDLLHSSIRLLEQADPSAQFPPLQRSLDQLEALSEKLKTKTTGSETPSQSIAATRLLAREGINAEQLAHDIKSFELKTAFEDVFPTEATSIEECLQQMEPKTPPSKRCSCSNGRCLVHTSRTSSNLGKFHQCPVQRCNHYDVENSSCNCATEPEKLRAQLNILEVNAEAARKDAAAARKDAEAARRDAERARKDAECLNKKVELLEMELRQLRARRISGGVGSSSSGGTFELLLSQLQGLEVGDVDVNLNVNVKNVSRK